MSADATSLLRCAECGERIVPGRSPGTFTHKARIVAACDLDSDHAATPSGGHAKGENDPLPDPPPSA